MLLGILPRAFHNNSLRKTWGANRVQYGELENREFHVPQLCRDVFRQMARIPGCKLQNFQNSRFLTKHTLRHQALCYERT